jgi:hypothetical protein
MTDAQLTPANHPNKQLRRIDLQPKSPRSNFSPDLFAQRQRV